LGGDHRGRYNHHAKSSNQTMTPAPLRRGSSRREGPGATVSKVMLHAREVRRSSSGRESSLVQPILGTAADGGDMNHGVGGVLGSTASPPQRRIAPIQRGSAAGGAAAEESRSENHLQLQSRPASALYYLSSFWEGIGWGGGSTRRRGRSGGDDEEPSANDASFSAVGNRGRFTLLKRSSILGATIAPL
jgi:hypothetical protein